MEGYSVDFNVFETALDKMEDSEKKIIVAIKDLELRKTNLEKIWSGKDMTAFSENIGILIFKLTEEKDSLVSLTLALRNCINQIKENEATLARSFQGLE